MEFSDNQRLFLATICAHFHEKGEWPTYRLLDQTLNHLEDNHSEDIDVGAVNDALRSFMYDNPADVVMGWEPKRTAKLCVRSLYTCQVEGIYPALKDDLDAFMQIILLCIEKYDAEGTLRVARASESEIRKRFGMSDLMLRKVFLLIKSTGLTGKAGHFAPNPEEWQFTVNEDMRYFRRVRTIEDYLQTHQKRIEQWPPRSPRTSFTFGGSPLYGALSEAEGEEEEEAVDMNDVFIVYGHDRGARFEVAHYIEVDLQLRAIMLDQIPEATSLTVAEAVERFSRSVGFAVVIMTPDDIGGVQGSETFQGRPRQNVLIELGYFWHKLGRQNIVILKKGEVEIPSDFAGILYVQMDEPGAWREKVRAKVKAAGLVGIVVDSA